MLLGMTDLNAQQTRALWVTALHDLAEGIARGVCPPPTSIDLWTQYCDVSTLLSVADGTCPEPLKISEHQTHASVSVPAGQPLGLEITWNYHVHTGALSIDAAARAHAVFTEHNEMCCVPDAALVEDAIDAAADGAPARMTGPAGSAHGAPDFRL